MSVVTIIFLNLLSLSVFSQTGGAERITPKLSLLIQDCRNAFDCQGGKLVFSESIVVELKKQFSTDSIEFYGVVFSKDFDPIEKKLFSVTLKVMKEFDPQKANFQYSIQSLITDHFEGRISDSTATLPANQKLDGYRHTISSGTYRDGDRIKKPEFKLSF